jgi:hypothetical protein
VSSGAAQAEGDDDDLFAFVSIGDEADEPSCCGSEGDEACEDGEALESSLAQVEDASVLPRTVESFLAAEPVHRAATFSFSAASSLHGLHILLQSLHTLGLVPNTTYTANTHPQA